MRRMYETETITMEISCSTRDFIIFDPLSGLPDQASTVFFTCRCQRYRPHRAKYNHSWSVTQYVPLLSLSWV